MKCMHCQWKMRRSQAPFHIDRKGYHLSLDAVPAGICGQCGEPYFEEREVKKTYRALCWGIFRKASGELRGAIGRHAVHRKKMTVPRNPEKGRAAWTDYRVVQQSKLGAEVECLLHTGRTHQIRVHLSHLGHPIWGDTLYGKPLPIDGFCPTRQMLHAARIEFAHPITGELLKLEAALPPDYVEARAKLIER